MAVSKDVRESSLAWRVLFAVSNVLIFAILYTNNVLVSRYSNCRYRWSSNHLSSGYVSDQNGRAGES